MFKNNKDKKEVLAAVKDGVYLLKYADKSLLKDKEIVIAAVTNTWSALQFADKSLKKDKEVVLAAINAGGLALEYADDSLKKDSEIVDAAIKKDPRASEFAKTSKSKKLNQKFHVTWEVHYEDEDIKLHTTDEMEAEDLDALIDELDKGLEEGRYTPEMDVEMHDGDFNIEYVLIETSKGKEVYRDEDYDG